MIPSIAFLPPDRITQGLQVVQQLVQGQPLEAILQWLFLYLLNCLLEIKLQVYEILFRYFAARWHKN
jgi:hypothetical protein